MGNPAKELAALLGEWRQLPPNVTVHDLRRTVDKNVDGWRVQVHAAGLLAEVARFLEAMAAAGMDVEHYQRAIPAWSDALFLPDRKWGDRTAATQRMYALQPLDMLRAVGDVFDTTDITVRLSDERTRTSLDAIDEILAALSEDGVLLGLAERRYVFELLNSCRSAFQEAGAFGQVDLLRRVHELLGVLTMLAESLQQDPKTQSVASRIMAAARRVIPYVRFGVQVSAGALGAGADLLQITSGLGD